MSWITERGTPIKVGIAAVLALLLEQRRVALLVLGLTFQTITIERRATIGLER